MTSAAMLPGTSLLDAWGVTLWQACWQGGLLVLAVWAICRLFAAMPARYQGWLWRLALLKFAVVLAVPTLFRLPLLPAPATASVTLHPVTVPIAAPQPPSSALPAAIPTQVATPPWPRWQVLLLGAWLLGVLASLARWGNAWLAARNLRRTGQPLETGALVEQLALLVRRFKVRSKPRLLIVPGQGSPMLLGIVRPTIVMPADTLRQLSTTEQALVLGHELAHLRRGDLLWNCLGSLVRAIFFFHPLVWLGQRQLQATQEMAADALAIAQQDYDPLGYGSLLVSVIEKFGWKTAVRPPVSTMSLEAAGAVHSLTRRLVAMSRIGRTSRCSRWGSLLLLGSVGLLGIVPWRLVAAEAQPGADASAQRYQATICINAQKQGGNLDQLTAPTLVYPAGQRAFVSTSYPANDKRCLLFVMVGTSPQGQAVEHTMQTLMFRKPNGQEFTAEEHGQLVKLASKQFSHIDPKQTPMALPKGGSVTYSGSSTSTGNLPAGNSESWKGPITLQCDKFLMEARNPEFVLQSPKILLTTGNRGRIAFTADNGDQLEICVTVCPAERPAGQLGMAEYEATPSLRDAAWRYYRIDAESYGIVVHTDAAGERHVAGVNKQTGAWKWLETPKNTEILFEPITGTDVTAFIQHGTPLSALVVYNGRLNKWSTYPLEGRVIDIVPCVSDRMVCYQLPDRVVAYSAAKDAWGMLHTNTAPAVGEDTAFVDTAEGRYEFPGENNAWSVAPADKVKGI